MAGRVTRLAGRLGRPFGSDSALVLPFVVSTTLFGVHLLLTALLVREAPVAGRTGGWRAATMSAAAAPRVVMEGVRTLRRVPVLRILVLVEVFWSRLVNLWAAG